MCQSSGLMLILALAGAIFCQQKTKKGVGEIGKISGNFPSPDTLHGDFRLSAISPILPNDVCLTIDIAM